MYDMFDINLVSQIQALDRKFSLANEKPRLKRKSTDDHRQKNSHFHENKPIRPATSTKDNDEQRPGSGIENLHANIDITV
jgi:hypothetical protein